jgi:predicted outer membrane repeat protein
MRAHKIERRLEGGVEKSYGTVRVTCLVVAIALAIPASAFPAVFDCAAGDAACLIAAINAANENPDADTILLEAGTYTLTAVDNGDEGEATGLPIVSSPITIEGTGPVTTMIQRADGVAPFRILEVAPSGDLTLVDLTIQNGLSLFGAGGAGILNGGSLSLNRVRVRGNLAGDSSGGGIASGGTLSITDSTIQFNVATGRGGGIQASGTTSIHNSLIANNNGGFGGGISAGGTTTIENSTIARNLAFRDVSTSREAGVGAGIEAFFGDLRINNCTIAENRAERSGDIGEELDPNEPLGGGLFNEAASVDLQNTILALNTAVLDPFGTPVPASGPDCTGSITSAGSNLVGDSTGCTITLLGSDRTGDPGLAPFQDDGTPGNGHFPLLADSQPVDAGDPAACSLTDQLRHSRIDGDGNGTVICDMGSIEFSPAATIVNGLVELAPLVTAFRSTPAPGAPAGTFLITATFRNTSANSIHDPFFQVTTLSGGNLLLNADGGPAAVGAIRTPDAGADAILSPDESLTVQFVIGLQTRARFTFLVDLLGVPGP